MLSRFCKKHREKQDKKGIPQFKALFKTHVRKSSGNMKGHPDTLVKTEKNNTIYTYTSKM